MDLAHLELLRELRDRGTITAVAEAGFRSPSAVSQQLRSAEKAFGVRLTEPEGRRLRLTPAGLLLADGASQIATDLARLQSRLDSLRGDPVGSVDVCGLPSATEVLIPPLLTAIADSGIEVALTDADIAEADYAQQAADFDVVIAHSMNQRPFADAGLSIVPVVAEPLDVAVPSSHRLARHEHLTAADLAGEAWIGVPAGFPFDTVRIAIENRAGAALQVVQRVRDNRVVEALVAQGLGCALLPRFTTRQRVGLTTIPLTGVGATRQIVAIARPDRLERGAVRAVVDHLVTIGSQLR
ncbi:MAG TPA: LysR family transcriptional regulator [Propionibacteriaceae bacterium]|nr:LysR family transcriptional regulator [Propionibacteriaceae bacterium]